MCQWRINLERLLRLALRRLRGDETPRPRIVESVCELDHEYPDVLGHRDDHLADGFGLGAVAVLELVELGDAIDEHGHFVTEVLAHHIEGVVGVFYRVVQQRGRNGLRSNTEVSEDLRDRDRVCDVWLAALAGLTSVSDLRDLVCPFDRVNVGTRMMRTHCADQVLDRASMLGAGEETREKQPPRSRTAGDFGHLTSHLSRAAKLSLLIWS